MYDYSKYIGIPYELNARASSGKLDCYGLIMLLFKDIQGTDIPEVTFAPDDPKGIANIVDENKPKWVAQTELTEGCVILFNVRGYGSHVGYYIGNDKMIHTWQGTGGVTIERISFHWKHRIMGIYKWSQKS